MFKWGVRVLLLMQRAKEGGHARTDRKATIKRIVEGQAQFNEALEELREMWHEPLRIYSTINTRSVDKAIRLFKYRQLDADYFDPTDRQAFYFDMENRWISCLKDGKAKTSSLFLFDHDNDPGVGLNRLLKKLDFLQVQIVDHYTTKNGQHIITGPFNPNLLEDWMKALLHKDALMLWSY